MPGRKTLSVGVENYVPILGCPYQQYRAFVHSQTHNREGHRMQSIFSSAAQPPTSANVKDRLERAGELKIHWAKPLAGCALWVLYGQREFQFGRTGCR